MKPLQVLICNSVLICTMATFGYHSANQCSAASLVQAEKLVFDHELLTSTKYVLHRQDKAFGHWSMERLPELISSHKIWWDDNPMSKGPFIGTECAPYIILGSRVYECHQGPKHPKVVKSPGDHDYSQKRALSQPTKKLSCPAIIRMKAILTLSAWQGLQTTRRMISRSTRKAAAFQKIEPTELTFTIFVQLPSVADHQGHFMNELALYTLPINKDVGSKLKELVRGGIKKVPMLKRLLEAYVKEELFAGQSPPPSTDRRFFPLNKTLRSHRGHVMNAIRDYKKDEDLQS